MRSDAHFLALRAAAKVALSTAALGGCSGTGAVLGPADGQSSEYGVVASDPTAPTPPSSIGKKPCDAGADANANANANLKCDEVLATTFGDGGAWVDPVNGPVSSEVKSCCIAVIQESVERRSAGDPRSDTPHHWDCCQATNWGADVPGDIGIACTPWGPPVPPAMRPRVGPLPEAWTVA